MTVIPSSIKKRAPGVCSQFFPPVGYAVTKFECLIEEAKLQWPSLLLICFSSPLNADDHSKKRDYNSGAASGSRDAMLVRNAHQCPDSGDGFER